MTLFWLDPAGPPAFPPTRLAMDDPNGLLAAGGALTPDWLVTAYRQGIFPWYSEQEPILWWSPTPRCVFLPGEIRVSRRLRRTIRQQTDLRITLHDDFPRVLAACAEIERPGQPGTWITPEMRAAYLRLHEIGLATAIAVWFGDELAGGLYGVTLGQVLFGESMFSAHTNGSSIALAAIDWMCRQGRWAMLDAQVESDHLMRMGATLLERERFEALLAESSDTLNAEHSQEFDLHAFLQDLTA
ncbi:MAG: leucyl/phenylalanyl-tRNA--protein transferase [Natronospirillum sp.]|uniref:leucyl/phenylalanyl-tRNA--protein transferase n=1 Tax=Natronospirillum sp. TaxID=2812955 RepID=UPI0025DAA95B|nr:leucyl/phenylalanyl-tRNA--protein transferase [Natronospirillum sp.]MCH8552642.1 leucyl/phenylalanyl-tRNA--protein transferase [Natronospirillum sp.]